MAKGVINLQKESGGVTKITSTDGIGITEVIVPESGELATKEYVDVNAKPILVANDIRAKTALNASGEAPIYACRAWVNFNGVGTVNIRASGNVSSITDNGIGSFTVNFATPMPDANYACVSTTDDQSAREDSRTPTSVMVKNFYQSNLSGGQGVSDCAYFSTVIFR